MKINMNFVILIKKDLNKVKFIALLEMLKMKKPEQAT